MAIQLKTVTFPSLEWFQALCEVMNADEPRFKKLGEADITFGVRVDDEDDEIDSRGFKVRFEDWVCLGVSEENPDAMDADFILEADFATWQEMIENIEAHGYADLNHTLNRLSLPGTPIYINGRDAIGFDCFARYNATLQEFFDSANRFHTEFAFG